VLTAAVIGQKSPFLRDNNKQHEKNKRVKHLLSYAHTYIHIHAQSYVHTHLCTHGVRHRCALTLSRTHSHTHTHAPAHTNSHKNSTHIEVGIVVISDLLFIHCADNLFLTIVCARTSHQQQKVSTPQQHNI
jgi:hypothetical protein